MAAQAVVDGLVRHTVTAGGSEDLVRVGSALTVLHRLDVADALRRVSRSPVTWERKPSFTGPQLMHDYLPAALHLLDDVESQTHVRDRLLVHERSVRALTTHGLTLPEPVRGRRGAGDLVTVSLLDVLHGDEWPQLLPATFDVSGLHQLRGSASDITFRHALAALAMRHATTSYRASMTALGIPTKGTVHGVDGLVGNARAHRRLPELLEVTRGFARRLDADAPRHRWGTRRRVLVKAAGVVVGICRPELGRHRAATLDDEELLTWLWFGWAGAHPTFQPGLDGDVIVDSQRRGHAVTVLERVGPAPRRLDRLLLQHPALRLWT